jgi:hypothetical protein
MDYLVAHALYWIGSMLGALKASVTTETFLPPWVKREPSRPSPQMLADKIAALPGATAEVPFWARG